MLRQRLISAAVLLPILLIVVFVGDPWYSLASALIVYFAYREFHNMMVHAGHTPLLVPGTAFSLLFVANAYLLAHGLGDHTALVLAGSALVPLVLLIARPAQNGAAEAWSLTVGGTLYAGWLFSLFILLRNLPDGLPLVLLAVLSTFACDSSAYLVGKAWGRHRMVPHLSPGKTWEGAAGGFVAALLSSIALALIFITLIPHLQTRIGLVEAAILGGVVGVAAQLGDLAESLLKRSVQAKDAGGLIPGHGGVLDRLDSLLFSGAAVYFLGRIFVS